MRHCLVCGKEFYAKPSIIKRGGGLYCSKECRNISMIDPSITNEERRKRRHYPEYYQWRNSVFTRDNYTCQHCGVAGGDLNAHHIKPYAKFKELRTDVNNGITLCKTCHSLEHNRLHREERKFMSSNIIDVAV